jgi:hypothetical protein
MEKFLENLEEANKIIKAVDHMTYVTYPLIKDKKIMLKSLAEISIAVSKMIISILHYEYFHKRIELNKNPKENFRTFEEKCAKNYDITSTDINKITELLDLSEKHKKSTMEFVRSDKVIIITNNMQSHILTIEKIKEFVILAKVIFRNIKNKITAEN